MCKNVVLSQAPDTIGRNISVELLALIRPTSAGRPFPDTGLPLTNTLTKKLCLVSPWRTPISNPVQLLIL